MWRKDEPNKPQSSPDPLPAPVSGTERSLTVDPFSPDVPASISQAIRIKGEISGRGDLFWDGVLEGKIRITDGNFTVGRNARINAEIEAREIIIHGEVKGTLRGERVQVSSTGKVTGDVETHGIVIEDGAMLRSKVQVLREDEPLQTSLNTATPRAKKAAAATGGQESSAPMAEKSREA
jgi:cytoskeletal protein CcmA (bactofilin family)